MQTLDCFWFLCLTEAPPAPELYIFRFSSFVGALAILVVVFQIVDFRYRFRLTILPFDIGKVLLVLVSLVGFGLLAMELWHAQGWLTLYAPIAPTIWQAIFAFLFLSTFIALTFSIFIRPPIFGRTNASRYGWALYQVIVKGNNAELAVVADELKRSSRSLVVHSARLHPDRNKSDATAVIAHDILIMIANPKFCRHIVASAQSTAIWLCTHITQLEHYQVPIGRFCKVVTEEAILNKDSVLHHETEEFSSDLVGHVKPWSKTMYGDYRLIANMGNNSPLSLNVWSLHKLWDVQHWTAYARVILTILKAYGETEGRDSGTSLCNAIKGLKWLTMDFGREPAESNFFESERYRKLRLVREFFRDAIDIIESAELPITASMKASPAEQDGIYDAFSQLMFETCLATSSFRGSRDTMWTVQHNTAWTAVFSPPRKPSQPLKIIQRRVVRLFYEKIREMDEMGPNYPGLRSVGLVLNVVGLAKPTTYYLPCERAIYWFAARWTRKNYLQLKADHPDVATALLVGSLEFDEETTRIAKRYSGWLQMEEPREFLEVEKLS